MDVWIYVIQTLFQNSRVIQLYFKISIVTKMRVNGHFLSMISSQNNALLEFVSNIHMTHFYILRKFNSCYSNKWSTGRQRRKRELKTKVKRCGGCLYSANDIPFYWDTWLFQLKYVVNCSVFSNSHQLRTYYQHNRVQDYL